MMNDVLGNFLLGISLAAPLGPSGVTIIQTGLRHGFLKAWITAMGVTMADATYLLIVYFGLARFVQLLSVKVALWTLGAVVLSMLGYRSIREGLRSSSIERNYASGKRPPLMVGYLVNISNPIAVVWWLAVFGSILGMTPEGTPRISALTSGSTILLGIFLWHSFLSALTTWGRRFLTDRLTSAISLVAGIALILFGLRFGYSAISAVIR